MSPEPSTACPGDNPTPSTGSPGTDPSCGASTSRRALAALAGLAGLVVFSWVLEARVWLRVTDDGDYAAAAAKVKELFKPGDAVTTLPPYALRPLERLGDLRGVGTGAALAGLCLGTADLWVVAEPGADGDLETLGTHYTLVETWKTGSLRVARFRVAPTPMWHAASSIQDAEVRLFKSRGPPEGLLCQTRHARLPGFTCPGEPDWMRATVEWMDLSGFASGGDRAIWMHPPAAGDRKVYLWRNASLGTALKLGASHTEYGARSARAPVHVTLRVGERTVVDRDFAPRHGWTVERVAIPPELQGAQDVKVVMTSTNNAANHFAVDLGVVP